MKQLYSILCQSISRTTYALLFFIAGIKFASIGQSTQSLINKEVGIEIKDLLEHYDKQIYFRQNQGKRPSNIFFKAEFSLGKADSAKDGMMVGSLDPKASAQKFEQGMREEEWAGLVKEVFE